MLTVLHVSDLQCGKPFRPKAAEALLGLVPAVEPDVVVAAGDLTQRAKPHEFRRATALLDEMGGVPVVVTPGNHDVPMYRFWERLFAPFMNWRRYVSPDLDEVTQVPGATFVALSSAAPHRAIVGGRLDPDQVEFARAAFREAPPADLRVLVTHHHFVPTASGDGGRALPRAAELLEAFEDMGVELVLGGHIHQTRVVFSRELLPERPGQGIPLVACGTTTSRRGRGEEVDWNSLNVLRIGPTAVEITTHRLPPGADAFERAESVSVDRLRPLEEPREGPAGGPSAATPPTAGPHGRPREGRESARARTAPADRVGRPGPP